MFFIVAATHARGALGTPTIQPGDNILTSLNCRETDVFTFEGLIGDRIVINVTECSDFGGVCGSACFCFDQCVELRGPDGSILAVNCTPLENNNASNRLRTRVGEEVLPSDGLYEIVIRDANNAGRGTYSIFLQRTNNPGRTTPLLPGDELLVTMNSCGEVDSYELLVAEGERLQLQMTTESGALDPRLELYDDLGRAVELPASGSIDRIIRRNGVYTLLARSRVDKTGVYRLSMSLEPPQEVLTLSIFPASGKVASSFQFDVGFLVEGNVPPPFGIVGGTVTLDGEDVTNLFLACAQNSIGSLPGGGHSFRCPGLLGRSLGHGQHELVVTIQLDDSTTIEEAVQWEVVQDS